jgi:hypothetical protein
MNLQRDFPYALPLGYVFSMEYAEAVMSNALPRLNVIDESALGDYGPITNDG